MCLLSWALHCSGYCIISSHIHSSLVKLTFIWLRNNHRYAWFIQVKLLSVVLPANCGHHPLTQRFLQLTSTWGESRHSNNNSRSFAIRVSSCTLMRVKWIEQTFCFNSVTFHKRIAPFKWKSLYKRSPLITELRPYIVYHVRIYHLSYYANMCVPYGCTGRWLCSWHRHCGSCSSNGLSTITSVIAQYGQLVQAVKIYHRQN